MATKDKASDAFTAEEKAAMQEHVKAEKAAARRAAKGDTNAEPEVLAKIAELPEPDRALATRVHEIVKAAAPSLKPRLYYGMPAYATEGGKTLASSSPRASSRRATRPSASTTTRSSTTAPCGRPRGQSPS